MIGYAFCYRKLGLSHVMPANTYFLLHGGLEIAQFMLYVQIFKKYVLIPHGKTLEIQANLRD